MNSFNPLVIEVLLIIIGEEDRLALENNFQEYRDIVVLNYTTFSGKQDGAEWLTLSISLTLETQFYGWYIMITKKSKISLSVRCSDRLFQK